VSLWSWLKGDVPPADSPGDPHGVEVMGEAVADRSLPTLWPSSWDGWPSEWNTPQFGTQVGLSKLIDVAWAAIDLNASVLASMPVYRLRSGDVMPPLSWMVNPDPSCYTSWFEFTKQLFWDYQMSGECFVLAMAHGADGYPSRFRVVPPWLITVELRNGARQYFLGGTAGVDVSDDILHIRYQSTIDDAHGHGPLEVGGARMTAAGLLQRYAQRIAETGGVPFYWMEIGRRLTAPEAEDLLNRWVESRQRRAGEPAIVSGDAQLKQAQGMNARDMTLLELSQFNEARIAVLLGVPPFLVGLPSALGESMTYSNTANLFEFHYRSSLCPKATAVMTALSGWVLPRGQSVELNRDDYVRPALSERAAAYKILLEAGVMSRDEVREMERLTGSAPARALTGVEMTGTPQPANPVPVQEGNTSAVSNS